MTSSKDQEQYWYDKRRPYRYVSVKQFADTFKAFHIGQKMFDEIAVPYEKERSHKAALSFDRYSVSNTEIFKANFAKEWLLVKRNSFIYIFKTVQVMQFKGLRPYFCMSCNYWTTREILTKSSELDV